MKDFLIEFFSPLYKAVQFTLAVLILLSPFIADAVIDKLFQKPSCVHSCGR